MTSLSPEDFFGPLAVIHWIGLFCFVAYLIMPMLSAFAEGWLERSAERKKEREYQRAAAERDQEVAAIQRKMEHETLNKQLDALYRKEREEQRGIKPYGTLEEEHRAWEEFNRREEERRCHS